MQKNNTSLAKILVGLSLVLLFLCGLILGFFLGGENCVYRADPNQEIITETY